MKAEHLGRYLFAADFLADLDAALVVDAGCGIGYGTAELAAVVGSAIGLDKDARLLAEARRRFGAERARFLRADLERDDLVAAVRAGGADAVVSFETLEHLLRPEAALARLAAMLRPGGCLICSVPNALHEGRTGSLLPRNRRHRQLYSFDALGRLLDRTGFEVEYRLGQGLSNAVLKRESELARRGVLEARLSELDVVHEPSWVRWFASVVAYPTVEDVDRSYSMIAVATKR